jgi:hypothetical protein
VLLPLATSGALVAALADAAPIAVLGGLVASVCGAIVASAHLRAFCIHRFSDALLLLGAATLAWALGGGFGAGEFTSDMSPRIAIESGSHDDARATAARSLPMDDDDDDDGPRRPGSAGPKPLDLTGGGKASLTIAALPGSLIFLDESKTPLLGAEKIPVRTPVVRLSIPAGLHVVRLRPPGAGEDSLLSHVVATTGQDVRIIAVGPTTSLRETAEQLAASWLQGDRALRTDLLSHEAWPGTRLSTLAALAVALGALLRLVSLASSVRDFVGVSALVSLPMLTLLARLSPLLTVEPAVAGLVAAAAALCALVLAARAACSTCCRYRPSSCNGTFCARAASLAAVSALALPSCQAAG